MANDDHRDLAVQTTRRKSSFSLAALLGVLTVCAVLLAWFVDHQRLASQIPIPLPKVTVVYRLSYASADLAVERLHELFESEIIVRDPNSNSVFVNASQIDIDRINMIIRYIDRSDTEFVDPSVAEVAKSPDASTTQVHESPDNEPLNPIGGGSHTPMAKD